jgi:peptidoglycan hydrolase-like protein with peptidoglycan-binding domain
MRVLAGATLVVVAAVVAAAILAPHGSGHQTGGRRPPASGAATVERRNLVTSENETGTISYAKPSTVADRLQGTLTWVPAVGRVIDPGERLFDVDNFPVILMNGNTPAFRTLGSSDSPGPDIAQLNANLIRLGFEPYPIVNDDEWQPATTDGVEAFQEANGEPETGSLTLGTVVFLTGPQRVAGLQGAATSVVDDAPGSGEAEFVDGTPTTSTATTTTDTVTTTTTPAASTPSTDGDARQKRTNSAISKLDSEVGRLQKQNQRLQHEIAAAKSQRSSRKQSHGDHSASGASGPAPGGDSAVLTTTSTSLVVTVDVPAGQQSVTHVGARVPVVMPSGSTVHGHVTRVGQASSSGGSSTVPITIHLDQHENGRNLDQATVSVRFVEKTARHVLSVPVTALLARPGGGYAVQEARAPYHLINVALGTFATGFVQVSGPGLRPGIKITDSQG